jgi:hypothetical protein
LQVVQAGYELMPKHGKRKKGKNGRSLSDYPGELAIPVSETVRLHGMLDAEQAQHQAQENALQRVVAKLPLLFEWYGIDPRSKQKWSDLAFRLAMVHVPGMQIVIDQPETSAPRARTWKDGLYEELLRDVNALRAVASLDGKRLSLSKAIHHLHADPTKD